MSRTVKINLKFDASGAVQSIKTADGRLVKLGSTVDRQSRKVSRFGKIFEIAFGTLMARAATSLLGSLQALVRGGINLFSDSLSKAGIQQIADRKLEQAIRNTGSATEEWVPRLKAAAQEVQRLSNFGDEQIQTAQALLLSFKEVAGPEGAQLLTARLADVAAGLSKTSGEAVDLNTVSQAIGRALTGGVGALTRYGISLSDVQKEQFKTATGMDRVRVLAQILDDNFKGLAEATRDPFKQLENAVGDLQESFASGLLPVLHEIADEFTDLAGEEGAKALARSIGEKLGRAIARTIKWFEDHREEIGENIDAFVDIIREIGTFIGLLVELGGTISSGIGSSGDNKGLASLHFWLGRIAGTLHNINEVLKLVNEGFAFLTNVRFEVDHLSPEAAALFREIAPPERQDRLFPESEDVPGAGGEDDAAVAADREAKAWAALKRQLEQNQQEGTTLNDKERKDKEKRLREEERLERTRQQLILSLMQEGLDRELAQIDQEFREKEALIKSKFPEFADALLDQLSAWRERARNEAFGLNELIDLEVELFEDDTFTEVIDGIKSQVVTSQEEMTRAVEEGVLTRAEANQQEIENDKRLQEAREASAKAHAESTALSLASDLSRVESAKEAANAVIDLIKREITALMAKSIAESIAASGPVALIVGPIIAAGVIALFNAVIPKFASGTTNFSGGLALVGERGPELVTLPPSANVLTNENTRAVLGSLGTGTATSFNSDALLHEVRLLRQEIGDVRFHISNEGLLGQFDRATHQARRVGMR